MTAANKPEPSGVDFLTGGGEMGGRMRSLDWSRTPLGAPARWPQSLKTIVRVMLDSRYAMWMLWGPEFTFFCNDAYLPTVGMKREWVLGARSDKVWEEIWPDIGPRIRKVLEHGEATWDEGLLLFLERSGFPEETYHTFSYSPVYDDDNRIAGMLCVVTEVTDSVISQRRLAVLRDLATHSVGVEGVLESCERSGRVLSESVLDVPFAAIYLVEEGRDTLRRMTVTDRRYDTYFPDAMAMAQEAPWPIERLFATQATQEVALASLAGLDLRVAAWPEPLARLLLLPLKHVRQGLAGILVIGVSPRLHLKDAYRAFLELVASQVGSALANAQAYEAERQRADALAELDRAKTVFFSNVSHEFRTPLTLMLGRLEEVTGDDRLPESAQERLQAVRSNAERLQKLVNSLLDFSRIEAGRIQASYEPVDLACLTRDLASTFRSAMERAGLQFTVDCEPLSEPVHVDREMWEKIVLNLLSNAFKFTFAGEVRVGLRREGDSAVLEVADTGVGVPEAELPRLFDRFHRVEGVEGRTHEGSGIGLAMVQELVKLHRGRVGVQSVPGKGSSFFLHIPFGTAHLPAERIRKPREQSSTSVGSRAFVQEALRWLPEADARLSRVPAVAADGARHQGDRRFAITFGARILLADDNADMRSYLQDLLSVSYRVQAVAHGEALLAAARAAPPDLILTDVMMPRMDGFALLENIRADAVLQRTPVILLSARAGEESRIEALDAGADDYVTKPFSARELLARIGALLELRHMRHATEEAFRLRTAQFETLLTEAPLGVYLVDAKLRVREANPTARAAFGSPPDLVGGDLAQIVPRVWPKPHADRIIGMFRRTLATGEPHVEREMSAQRLDRDGIECHEWQINRIPLPDGAHGVVCYFRDISAHVEARQRLEMADRQKDEFLAMLAHELRNPLAPIRSASELLYRSTALDPDAQGAAAIVERQVTNLARLVDDLLDVSRITQARVTLVRQVIALPEVISQAMEIVDPLVREKNHAITVTTHGTLRVHGDATRLVQCVANLLTNAAKYTDRGGTIKIECREVGEEALLTVTDNGVGIAPELLPHVFDLFVQSDRTLDRAQGGLGIGLSVVRRLIEMHDGRVSARSRGVGHGSVFEVRLPTVSRAEDVPALRSPADAAPQRILVIDDNEDAANALAMILRLDGHRVQCFYAADDVIQGMEAIAPDVAFLDIGLPKMNGYELARWIRAHPALRHVGLIALTGYSQGEDKDRARRAGFDEHLTKPADASALRHALIRMRARARPYEPSAGA